MNGNLLVVMWGILLFVGMILFAQFVGPFIMSYRITDAAIEVRLFGVIPQLRTEWKDIIEVRKISFAELLPWKNPNSVVWLRLANRLAADGVLVRRSRGIFRTFVITPKKPEEFIEELSLKLRRVV